MTGVKFPTASETSTESYNLFFPQSPHLQCGRRDSGIIQTRLDRETLFPLSTRPFADGDIREFRAKTVPGSVKKSDTAPIAHFRGKATPFE